LFGILAHRMYAGMKECSYALETLHWIAAYQKGRIVSAPTHHIRRYRAYTGFN
jgi:hypothetical protein